MPALNLSGANAALVAYGQIVNLGASGVTTVVNGVDSGCGQFTVTRLAQGAIRIDLPTGFGQANGRSLLFCTACTKAVGGIGTGIGAPGFGIDPTASQSKIIYTYIGETLSDFDFGFMLYENTLPHP